MRRLWCVPIIHDEVDLGSVGAALAQQSSALTGKRRWAIHREAMRHFWKSVRAYLRSFDMAYVKLYQDGLAAGGAMGRRVVEEAARRGSKNYQLLVELMAEGAELRQTEDPSLLVQEYERLRRPRRVSGSEPSGEERPASAELLRRRDRYIAERIHATLRPDDLGVLFIGANHDVVSHLPADVAVTMVKSAEKVSAYFEELLLGRDEERLRSLAQHLGARVNESSGEAGPSMV